MHDYGIWSILPPLIAIILAIRTKQVYISLLLGIWLSWLVIYHGNIFKGTYETVMSLVRVFKDEGNTKTIMFSALVGGLIILIQKSGGVRGFVNFLEKKRKISRDENLVQTQKKVQLMAALTGILIFVETSISSLTVGTVFRPVFDKLKISREKLAYIADSSSAPTSILIPFNAWGAFIMGLLLAQGFENGFEMLFKSLKYNFYPFLAILLVFIVIIFDFNIGPMKKAEERVKTTGKLLNDGSKPMISNELTDVQPVENIPHRPVNMLIPILTMVLMMPVVLILDGWQKASETYQNFSFEKIFFAIGKGSGSTAVLFAILTAIFVAMLLYKAQKILGFKEMFDLVLKGISEMMPLALLMMLAFAISHVTRELGTGNYIAGLAKDYISTALIPVIIFIISAFIAFSTGTSWGTFAIMIPIAIPMAQNLGVLSPIAIAAVLSGGVFGDHSSPISDTTIISSMSAATDHVDHVKTQLPYALLAGGISALLFLIAGFIL